MRRTKRKRFLRQFHDGSGGVEVRRFGGFPYGFGSHLSKIQTISYLSFSPLSLSLSPSQHLLSLSHVTPPPHCFPPIFPSYTPKIAHPVLLGQSLGKDTQGFSRITTLRNKLSIKEQRRCQTCSDSSEMLGHIGGGGGTEPAPWRNSLPPGVLWELDEISCSTASDSLDTARGEHLGVQTEVAKPADQGKKTTKKRLSDISQNDLMRKRAEWPGGGVTSCWGLKSRHPGPRLKSHDFHIFLIVNQRIRESFIMLTADKVASPSSQGTPV